MSDQPGLKVNGFDHVTLICADLEATRHFYVDFLGMTSAQRPAFPFPGLWFQTGSVTIHATQSTPESGKAGWVHQGNTIVSRGHHIAFAVDDVAEALTAVEHHGIRIASPLQTRPDGFKQLYIYDPDGHVVELVSR